MNDVKQAPKMTAQERIARAYSRKRAAFTRRPSAAKKSGATTIKLLSGFACEIEEGDWCFIADQPKSMGGEGQGPGPGFFGRASLGVCLAQGYANAFAKLGVSVKAMEVLIETDSDLRGFLGVADGVPPGYQQVRCIVRIESDAERAAVLEAMDDADRHSPWLYNFATGLNVSREVHFQ